MRFPKPAIAVALPGLVAAVIVISGGTAAGSAAGPAAETPYSHFPVTGYVLEGGAPLVIKREAGWVSDLSVDGALLTKKESSITLDDELYPALVAARRQAKPASLMLANFDNQLGGFSPDIGHRLLGNKANRSRVVSQLAIEVRDRGWDGVTIDLEALKDEDREGLVAFVTELRAALPVAASLDIDIPASTSPGGYQWEPFDRRALGEVVDRVVLMSYDQHYQGGTPGPVAGIGWVKRTIRFAATFIPRSKLRLGVAGYGYLWRDGKPTESVSNRRAREIAGARARWSNRYAEWTAKLPGGGVMWWSDARSMKLRLRIAMAQDLNGGAVWRLGSADNFR